MLQVKGLTKLFGSTRAVDDISLRIDRPQEIGIIGRSGAGKSTLLRILNRLTDATQGRILHGDRDILRLKGAAMRALQANCAMIFQQFNLVPRLDVVSNVLHGTLNCRIGFAAIERGFDNYYISRASCCGGPCDGS